MLDNGGLIGKNGEGSRKEIWLEEIVNRLPETQTKKQGGCLVPRRIDSGNRVDWNRGIDRSEMYAIERYPGSEHLGITLEWM